MKLPRFKLTDHAHLRFAQRVMHRQTDDAQTRERCVEYLHCADYKPSTDPRNLGILTVQRRLITVMFPVLPDGTIPTVKTLFPTRSGRHARRDTKIRPELRWEEHE